MTRAPNASPILSLYRVLTAVLAVIAPLWLARRASRGKEDRARLPERTGLSTLTREPGVLVWCHGASVGEALTLLNLIGALCARGHRVLLTTGTVTSAALMAERLPAGAFHQYIPLDHRPWVRRFLDHWQPDLVVWAESELWPNTLAEIARRAIPAYLVNARLSDRAFRGWQRWPAFAREVLAAFTAVLAQSTEDGQRFSGLGARDVRVIGNLKRDADALPEDPVQVAALTTAIGARPAWLAASIHPGEDDLAANTHIALKRMFPNLITVVAPRHPPKTEAMATTFAAHGLTIARRSRGEPLTAATDIYLADTLGELGTLYRAVGLVVMGKSFAVGGGQNPAEPAKLGCAVLCGPDMSNFRDLTAALVAAEALVQVPDAAALAATLERLLRDPAARQAIGGRGARFMAAASQVLATTLAIVESRRANPIDCT